MKYDAKDVSLVFDGLETKVIDGGIVSGGKSESSADIHGKLTFHYKDGKFITVEDCMKRDLEDINRAFVDHGGFNFVSMVENAFIADYTDVILIKFDKY